MARKTRTASDHIAKITARFDIRGQRVFTRWIHSGRVAGRTDLEGVNEDIFLSSVARIRSRVRTSVYGALRSYESACQLKTFIDWPLSSFVNTSSLLRALTRISLEDAVSGTTTDEGTFFRSERR